jgi:hypothetical protein
MIRRSKIFRYWFATQNNQPDNHFGFKDIHTEEKQPMIDKVFHNVANKYDIMNDAMSMGIHRVWKNYFVN